MLTKSMRKDISLRLGSHIKYTCVGVYYWDKRKEKFVLCEGQYYWTWAMDYYFHFVFETLFISFLWSIYKDLFQPEFEEVQDKSEEASIKLLTLVSGALLWVIITGVMMGCSVSNEFREEMCYTQNQIFDLDEQLLKRFITERHMALPDSPEQKRIEWLIKFDSYFLLIVPIVLGFALFIPGEPMHSLMEWLLEMKFGWNWETLLPWTFLVFGTYAMISLVVSILFLGITGMFCWTFWLRAATPDPQTMRRNWSDGLLYFKTAQLGLVSEIELIWLYRCFQLQVGLLDTIVSNSRAAYRVLAQQLTSVIAIFALIRFQNVIFTGNTLGFLLAGILVLAAFLTNLMMIIESFALDKVQKLSAEFMDVLLRGTKRNQAINKTVRSFKEITIHSVGPYYQVNKSSYLEWCDQGIDRLVSLLCTI